MVFLDNNKYRNLWKLLKQLDNPDLDIPIIGKERDYSITALYNSKQKFVALMNRKGHQNKKNLTFMIRSTTDGAMMRFDVYGAPHKNKIPTPHVHIFDEAHDNGINPIPLSQFTDLTLCDSLEEQLEEFLRYNNVQTENIGVTRPVI